MDEISVGSGSWESEHKDFKPYNEKDAIKPRNWQYRAYKKLKSEMFRWIVAPPGSGKTTFMLMMSYNDLVHNGIDKVVIIVPQNSIKLNYGEIKVDMDGEIIEITPDVADDKSVSKLKKFLKDDIKGHKINRRVLVCTHQALCRIDEKLLDGNISIWVDEAHHLSADESDDESINKSGSKIAYALDNCISVNVATATPARHDCYTLVYGKHRKKFVDYTLTIERHIKEHTNIEHMHLNVVKYNNSPEECITRLYERSKEPTIIWLPPVQNKFYYDDQDLTKHSMTSKLVQAMAPDKEMVATNYGWTIDGLAVVNLVSEIDRKDKLKLISEGIVDAIIALEMFKEGDDYPRLSRCIKIGIRRSPVINSQMNGRLFRHAEGKNKVEIYQVISNIGTDIKDKVSGFISSQLMMMLELELMIGQPAIIMNGKRYKSGTVWEDYYKNEPERILGIKSKLIMESLSFDNMDETKDHIRSWCVNNDIKEDDVLKITASILSHMAKNTKAFDKVSNTIDLDLIEQSDINGWYSKAIGVIDMTAIRKKFADLNIKTRLITMSKNKEPKPKRGTREYQQMRRYCRINKNGVKGKDFDPDFRKIVEDNTPEWIETRAEKRSRLLLEYAATGASAPLSETTMGRARDQLTEKENDRLFKIRPDWFNYSLTIDDVIRLHGIGASLRCVNCSLTIDDATKLRGMGVSLHWECIDINVDVLLKIINMEISVPTNIKDIYVDDYSIALDILAIDENLVPNEDDLRIVEDLYRNELGEHLDHNGNIVFYGKTTNDIPKECHRLRRFVYGECSVNDWITCEMDIFRHTIEIIDNPDKWDYNEKKFKAETYHAYHKHPLIKAFIKREKSEWSKDWGDEYDDLSHYWISKGA